MRLISPWSARLSRSRRIVSSETSKRALISVTVTCPSCLTRRRMSARRTAGSAESLWFCSNSISVINGNLPGPDCAQIPPHFKCLAYLWKRNVALNGMLAFNCILDNEALCCLFVGHGAMFCGKDAKTSDRNEGMPDGEGRPTPTAPTRPLVGAPVLFKTVVVTCPLGGKQ